jgi:hypothetical protein
MGAKITPFAEAKSLLQFLDWFSPLFTLNRGRILITATISMEGCDPFQLV